MIRTFELCLEVYILRSYCNYIVILRLESETPKRWQIHRSGLIQPILSQRQKAKKIDFNDEYFFWGDEIGGWREPSVIVQWNGRSILASITHVDSHPSNNGAHSLQTLSYQTPFQQGYSKVSSLSRMSGFVLRGAFVEGNCDGGA